MLAIFFLNTKILFYFDNVYHLEKEYTIEKALMKMFENEMKNFHFSSFISWFLSLGHQITYLIRGKKVTTFDSLTISSCY